MPDAILLLVPLVLLTIVLLFGFVGCKFDSSGLATFDPPGLGWDYRRTILNTQGLVAYWRLGEIMGSTAADEKGKSEDPEGDNPGTYKTLTLSADPAEQSPASAGTLALGAEGLIASESVHTSIQVDGGYVEVPFTDSLNPSTFTIEAWAHPEWDPGEKVNGSKPFRCVMASREIDAAGRHGFALYAGPPPPPDDPDHDPDRSDPDTFYWQIWIGTGAGGWRKGVGPEVEFDKKAHLAVTYDGTDSTLRLYVNGSQNTAADVPDAQMTVDDYSPNPGKPLYIGMGAPERVPPQTPLFPFKGRLQEAAVYEVRLTATDVDNHVVAGWTTGP